MTYVISKTFRFEAAHRLGGLPDGHQCGREHGHSYRVSVEIACGGGDLTGPGFVTDFGELKPFKDFIDAELDHRNLNDVLPGREPTSENLARYLFGVVDELSRQWPNPAAVVTAVRVSETESSWAEYRP